jgi:competence protein CoiA
MSQFARSKEGVEINALDFSPDAWEALKQISALGDFVMPCCNSAAALKTSITGTPFFAHVNDECATAPETRWHQDTKRAVLAGLAELGVQALPEVRSSEGRWQADVFFERQGMLHAIEIQRSPQTLAKYLRRQQTYLDSGVRSFWLVIPTQVSPLFRASWRLLRERGATPSPAERWFLAELPLAFYVHDAGEQPVVYGGGHRSELKEYLRAIVEDRYVFEKGLWVVEGSQPQAWRPSFGPGSMQEGSWKRSG